MISIIIPVYNVGKYIKRGLTSIENQTIFNLLEIIIINDGSTDNTKKICEDFCQKHKNAYLYNKNNEGVSSARNYGIKKASGEYVCFFDPDDTVEENMYETLFSMIEKNKCDIAMCNFCTRYKDGTRKNKKKNMEKNIKKDKLLKNFFNGNIIGNNVFDKIFRMSKIKDVKFPEKEKIGEDMFYIYEVLKKIDSLYINTKYCGYNYFKNENSAMNTNFSDKFFDPIKLSKRMYLECKEDKSLKEYAYAHYIHENVKVLEYMIIGNAGDKFYEEEKEIKQKVKKYNIIAAFMHLNFRQFCGFILIRQSPSIYMYFYKKMKVG